MKDAHLITMFTGQKGSLGKFGMCIVTGADNHKFNIRIRKEVVGGSIMLSVWIIDSAMFPCLDTRVFWGCFSTLQKCIDFEVGIWKDEREIKAFSGEAVAHNTNIDRSHGVLFVWGPVRVGV